MEEPFQIQYPKEQSRDESLAISGILVLEELRLIEKCSRILKKKMFTGHLELWESSSNIDETLYRFNASLHTGTFRQTGCLGNC